MRIWHEQLIPKLCRQHLLVCWREGLGCYKIITEDKKGYRNHPAVREFENSPHYLWKRLWRIRKEMIRRNYSPKQMPLPPVEKTYLEEEPTPWQTVEQQTEVLKGKKCNCKI